MKKRHNSLLKVKLIQTKDKSSVQNKSKINQDRNKIKINVLDKMIPKLSQGQPKDSLYSPTCVNKM